MNDDYAEPEAAEAPREDYAEIGRKWLERIAAADKREENWQKSAAAAEKAYLADDQSPEDGAVPEFNILHSNIETIVPAIYNSTPKPDIRPRPATKDPIGKVVADILEAAITAQIDDNALDMEIEAQAQDAYMAGRGVLRLKLDADVTDQPVIDPMTGQPVFGEDGEPVTQPVVTNERVLYEVVSWKDYREGPAKRWRDVPWVAYRHLLSKETLEDLKQDDLIAEPTEPTAQTDQDKGDVPVWEIWCKLTKRVYFVTADSAEVIKVEDDPLGLQGFFPQAEPVQPVGATNSRVPVCPYAIYKSLAEELDRITRRIKAIIGGLKVRGLIAGNGEGIADLAQAEDNTLIPAGDIANLMVAGGLDKMIMWWPLETAITVVRELFAQREQTKQAIYEITGISDIVRGASASAETATAQRIKTQWGSLRVRKMQRAIERQVRAVFKLTAEIVSMHFSAETLQKITGAQISPEAMQRIKAPFDHYRIDVESDSTIRADLTQNRGEMAEFLNGTAQFFGTMAPIVQQAPQAAGPLIEMYSAFARQFSLGKQAEDALDQFAQMAAETAKNPQPNPEAEAQKAEMQMKMADMQARQQIEMSKLQLDVEKSKLDVQIRQADLMLKQKQLELDESTATFDAAAKAVEIEMEDDQRRAVRFGE